MHRRPRPVAAWVLGVVSAVYGAAALVFVAGGRSSANELEGFLLGVAASVLLVGAVRSCGLVRLRVELRTPPPPR
jgi:zinc transporter ZupT